MELSYEALAALLALAPAPAPALAFAAVDSADGIFVPFEKVSFVRVELLISQVPFESFPILLGNGLYGSVLLDHLMGQPLLAIST